MQVSFRKSAINYWALLRKMTYKDSWLIFICASRFECLWINVYGLGSRWDMTHATQEWSLYIWDMTQSCVRRDSSIDLPPSIGNTEMIALYVGHDSFICETWVILGYVNTHRGLFFNRMQHTATHCIKLQYSATHCNTMQHTATHCNTWNCLRQQASKSSHSQDATHCNMLHQSAAHCNTLPNTATRCITLQHTATHCQTLQHTATHCITLQHDASHCNMLQHTAAHCNTLQHPWLLVWSMSKTAHCNTLPNTATHCNPLQNTVTHGNTLQHTAAHCNTLKHPWLLEWSIDHSKESNRHSCRIQMSRVCCIVWQYVCCSMFAVCCSAVKHCNAHGSFQWIKESFLSHTNESWVLQSVAVCCSRVMHCNTL